MNDFPIPKDSTRISENVCVDTTRIYDSCVSKDCLETIRVTFNDEAQALIDSAESIRTRDCDISATSIDVDEVPFNRGYYSVTVNFYFRLRFDTYSAPGAMPRVAIGYANFEKKCILYGSEGKVKIFSSPARQRNSDYPEAPKYTNPIAKVQAVDPVVLDTDVVEVCHCHHHCCTNFPDSIREALGAAWYLPEERQLVIREHMLDEMCSTLGGRAAEELFLNQTSTGAVNDLESPLTNSSRPTLRTLSRKLKSVSERAPVIKKYEHDVLSCSCSLFNYFTLIVTVTVLVLAL